MACHLFDNNGCIQHVELDNPGSRPLSTFGGILVLFALW
jgi:hypothetical protein